MPAVERWFRLEWMEHTPPFYCSVDIRNAGFKLAPVDTNLYPRLEQPHARDAAAGGAGGDGGDREDLPGSQEPAGGAGEHEEHFYLSNIAQLQKIFRMAGLNVRVGSIDPDIKKATTGGAPGGDTITLEPVVRSKRRLGLKNFDPCTILLNNDLGRPARHPGGPARAVPAAAAARGLVGAAQEPALPELRGSRPSASARCWASTAGW